jgi:hypothetical protein
MKFAELSVPAPGTAEFEHASHGRFRTVTENSATPSPVGIVIKCPLSSAVRNCSISRTIRLSAPTGAAVRQQQSRMANNVDEENARDPQVDLFLISAAMR